MKLKPHKALLGFIILSLIFNSCFKDDLLKEIDSLKTQVSDMKKRNDSLNNVLNVRADSLSKALASAQKRSDSLSNVLRTKSDSLSLALGLTNANLANLTKAVDSIKTKIATISGQLTQLNVQLTSITTQLTQLNQQLGALGGDVSQLAAQYQALSASLQTINTQIAALQAEQLKLLEKLNAILLHLNPPVDLTTGLVAFYPFNGNANDESGNGNNGTVYGAALTTDRKGELNKAYQFNGTSNNYIETIKSGPINSDITVSYWYKEDAQRFYASFILQYGGNSWGSYFSIANNWWPSGFSSVCYGPGFTAGGSGTSKVVASPPSTEIWHHVVISLPKLSHDIRSVKIYLDGIELIQECSYANYGAPSPVISGNNPIRIGKSWEIPDQFAFKGLLDDIRIYNRALSQSEITYLATH